MNKNSWDIGRCGYCGIRFEEMEKGHVAKCKKMHEEYIKSQNLAYQLNRIADILNGIK